MRNFHTIDNGRYDVNGIISLLFSDNLLELGRDAKLQVEKNRDFLESQIKHPDSIIYGINTGFGSLCNVHISDDKLEHLQENLVLSHACGMGNKIPIHIAKLILLLKIINLSKGKSGVRSTVIETMIAMYNHEIIPVIYEQGSLGASGDLAPLAHLSLPLIGYGKVYFKGEIIDSADAFSSCGIAHISLKSKEGLALLNGTQFSLAFSIFILGHSMSLWDIGHEVSAMSLDAFHCDSAPFDALIHQIRPHKGQLLSAQKISSILKDSQIFTGKKSTVQDPYSFRCIPQVHGASYQAFAHALEVIETELNSVTDNPLIFEEDGKILSGGNFHAQPLALVLDYMSMAMAELGSISERRVYQLINGDRGLPAFLTMNPGLDSGFMIVQYTAASIVSQSKQLCSPASVDSIVSSKGQEDHVSMAANAATKAYKILDNLKSLIAIEYLVAAQALDFRRPQMSSPQVESLHKQLREKVSFLSEDRLLHDDMTLVKECIEIKLENHFKKS